MSSVSFLSNIIDLHVVNEDYFPVKAVYDPYVGSNEYVGFYFGDTDLLEFSADRETGSIKKITLVLCNHYEVLDTDFQSATVCESGSISLDLPQHNECDSFIVRVYRNAVDILLSQTTVQRIVKCGQVLFGLSDDNELVSVTFIEMSETDVAHTIEELNQGMTND